MKIKAFLVCLLVLGFAPFAVADFPPAPIVIVQQSDCSGITSGACLDIDDGVIYTWNGSAVVKVSGEIGIGDDDLVEMDDAGPANAGEYVRLTANGLEGRTDAEVKGDLDLEIGTDLLGDLTDDATPQLGGALDLNSRGVYDAPFAFTSTDTTPSVANGTVFITANAGATTINDFDTELTDGKVIYVIVNDANTTFDFTSSGLEGIGNDYLATNGEMLCFIYSTVDSQWHFNGFPKTMDSVTFGGFTATRPIYSDGSGNLVVGDDGGHLEITGDDYEIKDNVVNSEHYVAASVDNEHLADNAADSDEIAAGAIDEAHLGVNARGSLTPVEDDPDNFAANFTGENLYGGTFIANAAGTAALPKAAVLMNFTYVVKGDNANILDPDETGTDDTIMMNGLDAAQNENLESSTTGHECVFQYYKADFWMATCYGFVEATP